MSGRVSDVAQWHGLRRAAALVAAAGACFGIAYGAGVLTRDDTPPEADVSPARATAADAPSAQGVTLTPAAALPAPVVPRRSAAAVSRRPSAAAAPRTVAAAPVRRVPVRTSAPVRRAPVRTSTPVRTSAPVQQSQPVQQAQPVQQPQPKPTPAAASKPATVTFFDDGG